MAAQFFGETKVEVGNWPVTRANSHVTSTIGNDNIDFAMEAELTVTRLIAMNGIHDLPAARTIIESAPVSQRPTIYRGFLRHVRTEHGEEAVQRVSATLSHVI